MHADQIFACQRDITLSNANRIQDANTSRDYKQEAKTIRLQTKHTRAVTDDIKSILRNGYVVWIAITCMSTCARGLIVRGKQSRSGPRSKRDIVKKRSVDRKLSLLRWGDQKYVQDHNGKGYIVTGNGGERLYAPDGDALALALAVSTLRSEGGEM